MIEENFKRCDKCNGVTQADEKQYCPYQEDVNHETYYCNCCNDCYLNCLDSI